MSPCPLLFQEILQEAVRHERLRLRLNSQQVEEKEALEVRAPDSVHVAHTQSLIHTTFYYFYPRFACV